MLTDQQIKAEAALNTSYSRGLACYRAGDVKKLRFFPDISGFEARVKGTRWYDVAVEFNENQEIGHYDCTCPAYYSYEGACKHIIAVMKAIQNNWHHYFRPLPASPPSLPASALRDRFAPAGTSPGTSPAKNLPPALPFTPEAQNLLAFFKHAGAAAEPPAKTMIRLQPLYCLDETGYRKEHWLEFSIGTDRLYVVKDIPQLLTAWQDGQSLVFGKNFTLQPQSMAFDEPSAALASMLERIFLDEQQRSGWSLSPASSRVFGEPRRLRLTDSHLLLFFTLMAAHSFDAQINGQRFENLTIVEGRPPLALTVNAVSGGLHCSLQAPPGSWHGLDAQFRYLFHAGTIYKTDPDFSQQVRPLLHCFTAGKPSVLPIPDEAVSDFVSGTLPALESIAAIEVEPSVYDRFYKEPLEKRVYLDKFGEGISARVEFHYGSVAVDPLSGASANDEALQGKWLLRSTVEENQLLALFRRHEFAPLGNTLAQTNEEAAFSFLDETLPQVQEIAEVYYSDALKSGCIRQPAKISAAVRLDAEQDLLDFSLQYEGASTKELLELLASYKIKKRYHRLRDGTFISLDSAEFRAAADLIEQLGLKPAEVEKQRATLPKYRALFLDSLARESGDFSLERNGAFKQMVQDIREPHDVEYSLPAGIQGKLRDYQKTGFKWLKSLAHYGLGGILADDMGLGKTLQVLTFLLSEKGALPEPSIVIAPTSLVYNWQDEVAKFAPDLKVVVVSGLQRARFSQMQDIETADLVVTSYALIKRDIALYEDMKFKYCFIDEAQHVKNANTLNAKAVKRLKAKCYFALTGTPIENSLTELWSIFDFLMPGYLRSHKTFSNRFEIPIVKNKEEKALQELNRHIRPFILRRMKKAVLKELPEKTEIKMTNDMTAAQAKLYSAWLQRARSEFEEEVLSNGFEKSQIKILSLLTRLRQLCCHPSLFIEEYHGGSGKLNLLTELISDAVSGKHRILLFSQFTGMLDLIRQELSALEIPYHYLDGSTKAEERIRLVHAFNGGEKDVFLISLKAGGTGLNLTGADVVIHYDPWWNPAVEDQATDRAYRIGQKNPVQVYKLITKGTIEEKIYLLQQKKKELIDTLIQPGEHFLSKMSETEIRDLFWS
ncbi:MAG: helicase associated domain protein [Firmicutes bacterium]|nr:helicase associated domain protein [Bacillota bacterium]